MFAVCVMPLLSTNIGVGGNESTNLVTSRGAVVAVPRLIVANYLGFAELSNRRSQTPLLAANVKAISSASSVEPAVSGCNFDFQKTRFTNTKKA